MPHFQLSAGKSTQYVLTFAVLDKQQLIFSTEMSGWKTGQVVRALRKTSILE